MNKALLFILLTSLTAVVGCGGGSSTSSDNAVASRESTITATDSDVKNSYKVSYSFEGSKCKTGEQSFYSKESYCRGLQNETLNNSCAIGMRKMAFKISCKGDFISTNEKETSGVDGVDLVNILVGSKHVEVAKTAPDQRGKVQSGTLSIGCENNLDSETYHKKGYTLLKDSKALITSKFDKKILIKCNRSKEAITKEFLADAIYENEFTTRTLSTGHALTEAVIISSILRDRSEMAYVSCFESAEDAAKSDVNGIALVKGSSLVVKRDLGYVYGNGRSSDDSREVAVIRCK